MTKYVWIDCVVLRSSDSLSGYRRSGVCSDPANGVYFRAEPELDDTAILRQYGNIFCRR